MTINVKELKMNIDKYLEIAKSEDINITKNGRIICKLSSNYLNKKQSIDSLVGILPKDATEEEGKEERLRRHGCLN